MSKKDKSVIVGFGPNAKPVSDERIEQSLALGNQEARGRRFEISADEDAKINDWLESIKAEAMLTGPKNPLGDDEPYYGAIGGGVTYTFTPTGLGVILKVKESHTGKELDLTDYDSW